MNPLLEQVLEAYLKGHEGPLPKLPGNNPTVFLNTQEDAYYKRRFGPDYKRKLGIEFHVVPKGQDTSSPFIFNAR